MSSILPKSTTGVECVAVVVYVEDVIDDLIGYRLGLVDVRRPVV